MTPADIQRAREDLSASLVSQYARYLEAIIRDGTYIYYPGGGEVVVEVGVPTALYDALVGKPA